MRRSPLSATTKKPLASALAFALLLAALLLPSCAPAPVDYTLIDGSECTFDSECKSGHCWQADSEETATCKAAPEPGS